MGNLLFHKTVNETTIGSRDILYLGDDNMMSNFFTFRLRYHSEILTDCRRIFKECLESDRSVVIYWNSQDFTIHGIQFKDDSRTYIDHHLQPSTFGFIFQE